MTRELDVHRRMVHRAWLTHDRRRQAERERPVLNGLIPFIEGVLEVDRKAPRKQRHPPPRRTPRGAQPRPVILPVSSRVTLSSTTRPDTSISVERSRSIVIDGSDLRFAATRCWSGGDLNWRSHPPKRLVYCRIEAGLSQVQKQQVTSPRIHWRLISRL